MNDTAAVKLPEAASDGFEKIRHPARKHFLSRGWPTRRNEAYKYTDLSALARREWPRPDKPGDTASLPNALGTRVLWTDGFLANEPENLPWLHSLRTCAAQPAAELTALLGRLTPEDDPIVALNTALFDHGTWIRLDRDDTPDDPIELTYASGKRDEAAATHARLALDLENGAS